MSPLGEPPPDLHSGFRGCVSLVGILSLLLALPTGFIILVVLGGGHGSPFPGPLLLPWLAVICFLAIPLLMIGFGIACLRTTSKARLNRTASIGAAIPASALLGYCFFAIAYATPSFP